MNHSDDRGTRAGTDLSDQQVDLDGDLSSDLSSDMSDDTQLDGTADPDDMNQNMGPAGHPLGPKTGQGIFREGCPREGFAHARALSGPGELGGVAALADQGDLLLMNQHAAFVIQDPTRLSRTWWYYGGQLVDAVPIVDCTLADIDRLDSLGVMFVEGQLNAILDSSMRAFMGERAEVLHDGADGQAARVRVYGSDAPMWLVEYELLGRAIRAGAPRLPSEQLELEAWIDYILEPDSHVIRIEVGATNLSAESRVIRSGMLTFFGDEAAAQNFAPSELNVGGLNLKTGLPWISAGRMALALDASNSATAHFAGVDLLLDLSRFIAGDRLSPHLSPSLNEAERDAERADSTAWKMSFAVHERGLSAVTQALALYHPRPSPGRVSDLRELELTLRSSADESAELREALTSASLSDLERPERLEVWLVKPSDEEEEGDPRDVITLGQIGELNLGVTPPLGVREGEESGEGGERVVRSPISALARADGGERYQLRYYTPGLPELRSPPLELDPMSEPAQRVTLELPARGLLSVSVSDDNGGLIPAALRLTPLEASASYSSFEEGSLHRSRQLIYLIGERQVLIAPGRYRYSVTRGYEYQPQYGEVDVRPGVITPLSATLAHLNPTPDYVSFDGHVHAGPSADSDVLIPLRLRGAAAEGVEVVAGTDHEVITDWTQALSPSEASLLSPWVSTVVAEESTASLPEHMNIYPLPLRDDHPRGDPPLWYGAGFDTFIELQEERGATIRQLNHPRLGCNYLCLIEYNRVTGEPDTQLDLSHFGFDEGLLWGWGFNAIELLNGPRPIFMNPDSPNDTGLFEDWASFLNHGHRVTAMGVTDSHRVEGLGAPVTLVQLNPLAGEVSARGADPERVASAILAGRAQISLGAWANLTVEGAQLGDLAIARPDPDELGSSLAELQLQVRALPEVDVQTIYLFVNCNLAHTWESSTPNALLKLDITHTLNLTRDAWVSVAAFGENPMPDGLRDYDPRRSPRVITNAIYIDADRDGAWTPPGGQRCEVPPGRW